MRIFYVTSCLGDSGGSEIYTRDIIKEFIRRGHDVFVFTSSHYKNPSIKTYNIRTFGHHGLHKFELSLCFRKAVKLAREFRADIVQTHGTAVVGLIGHFVKNALGIPHITLIETISSIDKTLHARFVFATERFLVPRLNYDGIAIWNERIKDKFLIPWGIDKREITIVPVALDLEGYDPSVDTTEVRKKYGENLITCMKTFYYRNAKGIEYLIEAMKIVSKRHPEYRLLIFGGGEYRKHLEDFVKEQGVGEFVKLPGFLPPEVYKKVCVISDVAPHSFTYGISASLSLLEYMAMGISCVVTDIGSIREFTGDSVLLVKPKDPKSIADGIIKLIENPELRKKLGEKARERAKNNYSIRNVVDKLEVMFNECKR
ncbi:MAG: glycosyltransferase family 4 protein [Candidatus Aenigmarchaeota archaeon]